MPHKIIFLFVFASLYAAGEAAMGRRQARRSAGDRQADRGSLIGLYLSITLGYACSFAIGATRIGRLAPWNLYFALGCLLIVVGLAIRVAAIRTLDRHFTYTVTNPTGQELITTGLYRHVRHPGYLGQLILFAGITLALANWLSVLAMLAITGAGYGYRIAVEERALATRIGAPYAAYRQRSKKLVPFLF
jgi:protein-S-isoprenylcysteine O-methyltransferase Ste14